MFKIKFLISITIFVTFLITTSIIKNKTRVIEKQIKNLNNIILIKEKNANESELDFYYLSSPIQIEKKLNLIGFNKYQPIKYSNIYFDMSDFTAIQNKFSNLNSSNGKKIKKK
tara:strand:- start:213 stop:551 length:339 start_codon:yes stop_codon:yes gene_type:complete